MNCYATFMGGICSKVQVNSTQYMLQKFSVMELLRGVQCIR